MCLMVNQGRFWLVHARSSNCLFDVYNNYKKVAFEWPQMTLDSFKYKILPFNSIIQFILTQNYNISYSVVKLLP